MRTAALFTVLVCTAAARAQCPGDWLNWGAAGPSPRQNHVMVLDPTRNVLVLFGGYRAGSGFNGETWEWDGEAWGQVVTPGPSPRANYAMAFDSARGGIILFGGAAPGNVDDTWAYNPGERTWAQRLPATVPPSRYNHAMAFDAARQRIVMFGGFGAARYGDTWTWDGNNWELAASTGPSPRNGHAMAYDAARERVVLFGGFNGARLSDTWEWNGSSWTQRFAAGPSPRQYLALEFDPVRRVVTLYGGQSGGCSDCRLSDTWDWNGTSWSLASPADASIRDQHTMAYFPPSGLMVIHGGYQGNGVVLADTWVFERSEAPTIDSQPVDQSVAPGETGSFTVGVTAAAPTYQWRRNQVDILDGGRVSGATTPTLTITGTVTFDSGSFDCVITDPCGTLSTDAALLTVGACGSADFNADGDFGTDLDIEDFFSCLSGACCQLCGSADFNADGDTGSDADIEAFFRVLAGGTC